jgi:DNA end-binding protein Ku
MAARAIWKGVIKLEDRELPVKLYSAVENRDIHFHLLHDQDHVRVQQRMVNAETNKTVKSESTKKGFQIEPDTFVVFEEAELDELEPKASRDIEIEQFVDVNAINHQWFDRPYWLGPDGDEALYFEFVQALAHQNVQAVARWTMRKKRYIGVLRAEDDYLALLTLHHAEEIIPADKLDAPTGRALEKKEKALAGQLISALEAKFDHSKFQDEYRERVRKLIQAKHKGKTIEVKRSRSRIHSARVCTE